MLLTNNPKFVENQTLMNRVDVCYMDLTGLEMLKKCRAYVQNSYKLLTHPLYGNFRANEIIYRTFLLEKGKSIDLTSLELIENAVNVVEGQVVKNKMRPVTNQMRKDYAFIDYEIIMENLKLGGRADV